MNRPVDEHQIGISSLQALHRTGTTMGGAVIHDPKHSSGLTIRQFRHDLCHQAVERDDAALSFTAAKELHLVDIERGQIGPRPAPLVFVFHLQGRPSERGIGGMTARSRLDAGFLIGAQDELIILKSTPIPHPVVKVQDSAGLAGEVGIARKDPRPVSPGSDGILMEPAPYGAIADGSDEAALTSFSGQFGHTPSRERHLVGRRHFTRQRLDLNDQVGGKIEDVRALGVPPGLRSVAGRIASRHC